VDARIQRSIHHLATHSAESFNLEALAERCGLSPSRFSHLFRAETGTTPQQFAEKLRMETARQLLAQTNLSVAEIGAEVGYEDPLYFSRRFRRFYGKAPSRGRAG
jgi:AraC family transcriptional regulator, arabinose operon regulatory protein